MRLNGGRPESVTWTDGPCGPAGASTRSRFGYQRPAEYTDVSESGGVET